VVEAGRTRGGCGRARRDDRALSQVVACWSARAAGRNDRLQLPSAGGEEGGRTQAAAVVDGWVLGLAEEVFDGITSIQKLREGGKCQKDDHPTHGS